MYYYAPYFEAESDTMMVLLRSFGLIQSTIANLHLLVCCLSFHNSLYCKLMTCEIFVYRLYNVLCVINSVHKVFLTPGHKLDLCSWFTQRICVGVLLLHFLFFFPFVYLSSLTHCIVKRVPDSWMSSCSIVRCCGILI